MNRMLRATALAGALCLVFAAPVVAIDDAQPFSGGDRVVDTFDPPTDCPDGALWRYSGAGTGSFLHLGDTSVELTHCTFMDEETGTGTFGPGTISLTAADGDVLRLMHVGTFRMVATPSGPTPHFDMAWVVVGGTGRFEEAAGGGNASGSSNAESGITEASYEGEIDY